MKEINIGLVVRTYNKAGDFEEERYDHVSYKNMPANILDDLIVGELICVELLPDVEAFYFKVPADWPENWTELGSHNHK